MKDDKPQETVLSLQYPTFQTVMLEYARKIGKAFISIKNSALLFFPKFSNFGTRVGNKIGQTSLRNSNIFGKIKRPIKKFIPIIILIMFVLPVVLLTARKIFTSKNAQVQGSSIQSTQINEVPTDIKAKNFEKKEFVFPIKNSSGTKISEFKYSIESAELLNEIYVKGQKATALKDKLFLIVSLKLTNNQKQGISINARDYVRLSVNKKDEWLAPDIHNDPVEIQAISTKYTRVGFMVNTSDTNPVLQVGEIDGTKQKIELKFK